MTTTSDTLVSTKADLESEVRHLEERLRATELKLEGIKQIGQILASDPNLDTVLQEIIRRTTALMGCERATLFLVSEDGKSLWSKVTTGGQVQTIEMPIGSGIAGWVAEHGRSVNVKDAYKDPRFDPRFDHVTGYRTKSILCQPLRDSRQQLVGVLQTLNKHEGYFSPADEGLLLAIASQAAVCIQNSRLYLTLVTRNIDLLDTQLRLQERTSEIELLFRVERAAAVARHLGEALDGALEAALGEYPADAAIVLLADEHDDSERVLLVERAHGPAAQRFYGRRAAPHEALIAEVLSSRSAVVLDADEVEATRPPILADVPVETVVGLPIARADEEPIGVLLLVNPHRHTPGFGHHDIHKLGVVASRMALSAILSRAEEEERKAERLAAVGGALSGVVHDLRTPLTIISGYARLLEKEQDPDKRHAHREVVKKQVDLINVMIQEVLGFARGSTEVLLRKVWVREFLAEVEEMLNAELDGTPVTLVIAPTFKGAVKMDDAKMRRAVANLARNAKEAMGQTGGSFRIGVVEADGIATFSFSDTGPGIPREMERRLFEKFASHGKESGTGLGLAIVKKIVDEHGGTLGVTSVPGEGTTFTIGLPVA
ncbi:MAG: GAF domain-containing protein [Myxococcota bacterium]